ncbi:glycerophosphodiester phosphodiesterase, partial [Aduncisulcus paluster]
MAYKNGADYAEIDVQQTRDGHLVLLHDSSFKRTTGVNETVWDMTLEEIRTLDAGSHFDERFAGEPVPTLEEAIEAAKGKIKLNIEIKVNGHETDIERQVVEEIYKMNFQ